MASRPERLRHAYRIASSRHPLMDGGGAFRYGGRWNSPGRRAIYAAETYAGALLEVLAHANIGRIPADLVWIRITLPPNVKTGAADSSTKWNSLDYLETRELGDKWLVSKASLLLIVPSVVTVGIEKNIVINPDHRDFQNVVVTTPQPLIWDERLFTTMKSR